MAVYEILDQTTKTQYFMEEFKTTMSFLLFMAPLFIGIGLTAASSSEKDPVKSKNEAIAGYTFLGIFGLMIIGVIIWMNKLH